MASSNRVMCAAAAAAVRLRSKVCPSQEIDMANRRTEVEVVCGEGGAHCEGQRK